MGEKQMKNKSIVARRKRHELRSMVLELAAKVEWKEVELLAENVENNQLKKEIGELKSKFDLSEVMLKDTMDKLIAQRRVTDEAAKGNEEMVKDFYEQSKDINRLNDVVIAANAELDRRDTIISNLNSTISDLQLKVINLSNEMGQLKKPMWKKVKECLVK